MNRPAGRKLARLPGGGRSAGGVLGSLLVYGLVALVVAAVAVGLWRRQNPVDAGGSDLLTYEVQPIDLRITALENGTLESASQVDVFSEVEGQVAIIKLVSQGTQVAAGEVVVELDSAALRTRRTEQLIIVERARGLRDQAQEGIVRARSQADSDVQAAKNALEFAQADLKKYIEAEYPLALRTLQSETTLAQEELERARVRLQVSEDLFRDRYIGDGEVEADRLTVKRAQARAEIAKEQERVLQDFTFPRTRRELESKKAEAERALERVANLAQSAVQQADKTLATESSTLQLEEGKLARLESQLEECTLRAPQAGIVVYPVPIDEDRVELYIKEGNTVRERQLVFSIPDTDLLQVSTSIHEALVNRIKPGMPARLGIDMLPDLELHGQVKQVSPLPDPEDWRKTTVKFYETKVSVDEGAEGLRPGMSAKVEILIDELQGVLAVPVQAVVQQGELGVCYVLRAGGPELRRLRLGKSSDQFVAVEEGLRAGERVVLSPDTLGIPSDVWRAEPASAASPGALADRGPAKTSEPAPAQPATSEPAPEVELPQTEYEVVLSSPGGGVIEAQYEIETQLSGELMHKFKVEVLNGPPNAVWQVALDGVVLGDVTLDAAGNGEAKWSEKKGTLPADFPLGAGAGSSVRVGEIEGALSLNT